MAFRHRSVRALLTAALLLLSIPAFADNLVISIQGLKNDEQVKNVEAHFGSKWVSATSLASQHRREKFLVTAEESVAKSLRPYGFYFPKIASSIKKVEDKTWELELRIDPGPPIKIRNLVLEVQGSGSEFADIRKWQADWPLLPGKKLNQIVWTSQKDEALSLAEDHGYLSASFPTATIELDLDDNVADLTLVLDTGQRAVMGTIEFKQDEIVKQHVLNSLPRFDEGDYYLLKSVDRFRGDLWRTGYFEDIDVVEKRHLDQSPPRVDFLVTLTRRKKDTHQGTFGYGTDSQIRVQYSWQRHLLSDRGDSLGVGVGWQQNNEELQLAGEYRLPRKTRSNQYWMFGGSLKTVSEVLRVDTQTGEYGPALFDGGVEDMSLRFGKVALRGIKWGSNPIIETLYVEGLRENTSYRSVIDDSLAFSDDGISDEAEDTIFGSSKSITLGINWDWTEIEGKRFITSGHHEKAWLFTANDAWGSGREFTQAYLSSRRNFVLSDRWKLLFRAEVGYTDAVVYSAEEPTADDVWSISLTELPSLYRFKAGGSRSVRGYGFEELSNNNIGSNNIVTASAEVEYQFRQDWSLAAYYDIGNAFNDWNDMNLKVGIGLGVRWYTLAGAIRVDVAQAQDLSGKPWQVHLTIGTPLL